MQTTLLYVDGSTFFRRLVDSVARDHFDLVYTAASIAEANTMVDSLSVSLLISAQQLPDGLGTQLIETVTNRYGGAIPCVLVTADDDLELRKAALAAGAIDYLPKKAIREGAIGSLLSGMSSDHRVAPLLRAATVWVLDDSRTFRTLIQQYLEAIGVRSIRTYGDSASFYDALDGAGATDDDLEVMLVDLVLPDTSGPAVIRRVRRGRPRAIIIAMSSLENPKAAGTALNAGADDFIPKPFDGALLRARLERSTYPHVLLNEVDRKNEALHRLATTDRLTGIPNRAAVLDYFENTFHNGPGDDTIAVAILDIDHFKTINDRHGHLFGDRVLQRVAASIEKTAESLRSQGQPTIAGRYGGEEFLLVAPGAGVTVMSDAAETIRCAVKETVCEDDDGAPANTTISAGVTCSCGNDASIDSVINRADKALYEAKEAGRNRVVTAPTST